jgi:hypothetical protein
MAHLALHFPVVKRNTDSSFLFELRELKELPVRFVFMARPLGNTPLSQIRQNGTHRLKNDKIFNSVTF